MANITVSSIFLQRNWEKYILNNCGQFVLVNKTKTTESENSSCPDSRRLD